MNLVKGFSDRTVATGKISFGLRRTNLLKATIHWSRYFRRISQTPSLIGIRNTDEFFTTVEAKRQRARIRNLSGLGGAPIPPIITWGLARGGLTACGVFPGVVLYPPVRIKLLVIHRTYALMRSASVMTSFVKGIAIVCVVPQQVTLIPSGEQVAKYSPGFTSIGTIYWT